jgi:hypothetical protein
MAVTLPDRSPLASREASRARAVKAPGAANVPQVAQARDPGLNAPAGAFGSGLEGAGEGLERAVDAYAAAEQRAKDIDDTVARTKAVREFDEFTSKTINDFNIAGDPTNDKDLSDVYMAVATKQQELMESNKGMSAASLARLDARFTGTATRGSTSLAEMKINAGKAILKEQATGESGAHALAAYNDPSKLFDLREKARASVEEVAPGFSREEEEVMYRAADAAVVTGALQGQLKLHGRVGALNMLNQPGIADALGAAKTIAFRDSVKNSPRPARPLSPQEMRAWNIPDGTVAQMHNGKVSILVSPPGGDGTKNRDDKIASLVANLAVSRPEMTPEARALLASKITDKVITIELTEDGFARIVDQSTGTVDEITLGVAGDTVAATAPPIEEQTLSAIVAGTDIAGLKGAAKTLAGNTVGQLTDRAVDRELFAGKQEMNSSLRELARGLSVGSKHTTTEMTQILTKELPMTPSAWKSKTGMLSSMVGFKRSMEKRLAGEMKLADDPNMPSKARGEAKTKVHALQAFLTRLGDPAAELAKLEADTLPAGVPEGSVYTGQLSKKHPTMGIYKTKEGKSVYGKRK